MARYLASCCGKIVESKHVHDFRYCPCGKTYVDGGDTYQHYGWEPGTSPPRLLEEDGQARVAYPSPPWPY